MHTPRQLNLLLITLALAVTPVFADSLQVTETTTVGQAKYAQRIKDLDEQIHLIQSKGLLSQPDASKFLERLAQLKTQQEEVKKGGYQKPAADELEKAITTLNGDLFKASHKSNPVKAGQAEKEVNDPNLIPAYPDANLQPGSKSK